MQAARALLVTLLVASGVFFVALDNGTYGVTDRAALALAVWWAVAIGVALRLLPRAQAPRSARTAVVALALLAALTGASIGWSDSAERAFAELDRVLLYLGVLSLVVLCTRRGDAPRWSDGLALGISAVGVLALAAGLYPDAIGSGASPSFFPSEDRLLYPLNYWNGLAVFIGLAFPLLLRVAVAGKTTLWRALALAPVPALTAAIYLTSSRGGAATALVGVLCFVALTDRRPAALAAALLAGAGAAATVAVLLARHALVDGPHGSAAAAAQADGAALAIAAIAAAGALVWWAWCRLLDARVPRHLNRRIGPAAYVVCVAALVGGGIAAGDPVQKLHDFRRPPQEQRVPDSDFTRAHLLDSNGSGRWQVWSSSYDQFEEHPLLGDGAGSFEAWWASHATVAKFMRDAHSLFLETLGELGLIGLALLLTVFGAGLAAAVRRLVFAAGEQRATIAALAAVLVAFLVAANIDWMWELTAVGLVGVVALGLLVGAATQGPQRSAGTPPLRVPLWWRLPWGAGAGRRRPSAPHWRRGVRVAVVAVAALAICLEGVLLMSQSRLQESRAAAEHGDRKAAVTAALGARALQPWASSPYLQLSLLAEQDGDLATARRWIARARDRGPSDWRLWLVSARLATKAGAIETARVDLAHARALNPRSPLFAERGNQRD